MIHVWDADLVEEKNLERQLFYEHEVGQHKSDAFASRWPSSVSSHREYVGEDNISRVIADGDTVLVCADNMAVRRLVNERAKALDNVCVINGGNELYTGSVQLYPRRDGAPEAPALDFASPEFDPDNDDVDRSELSCAEIAVLPGGEQTMVANQTVAAMMMAALWRYDQDYHLPQEETPRTWTKMTFDHEQGLVQTADVRMLKGWTDAS
jgi:molybdopterin/thiamine biosynthesis adenylyltransferase